MICLVILTYVVDAYIENENEHKWKHFLSSISSQFRIDRLFEEQLVSMNIYITNTFFAWNVV